MSRTVRLILLLVVAFTTAVSAQDESLRVGGAARVYVEDDGLKLRSGPSVGNSLIETMPSGTIVEIIGGPSSDGTYVWWNVRAPSGSEGWSVEAANGLQTLVPVAVVEPVGVEVISAAANISAGAIHDILWSPDDSRVAVGAVGYGILFIDVASGEITTASPLTAIYPQIRWSTDGRYVWSDEFFNYANEDISGESVVIDADTGIVAADADPETMEWLEITQRLSPIGFGSGLDPNDENAGGCPPDCGSNAERLIEEDRGILKTGNPATFAAVGGTVLELGDGRGGLSWHKDSDLAVIWADMVFEGESSAEVWNLVTGEMLARVPHNSVNGWAGSTFPEPAFLSNDETKLAAVVVNPDFTYTLTLYRIVTPE